MFFLLLFLEAAEEFIITSLLKFYYVYAIHLVYGPRPNGFGSEKKEPKSNQLKIETTKTEVLNLMDNHTSLLCIYEEKN